MDTFARGLRNAAKLVDEAMFSRAVQLRYSSYDSGIGEKIENGEATFEELEVRTYTQYTLLCTISANIL